MNKVEVWFAKHTGLELSEGALTTWLARLPDRLPTPEPREEPQTASLQVQALYLRQERHLGPALN